MTASARIPYGDAERVTKAVKSAGYENVRFIFDLANQRIEVIVGGAEGDTPPANPWDEVLPK